MKSSTAMLVLAATLAGCGATPSRITLPPAQTAERVSISVGSLEVSQASLPLYAESEEIAFADAAGVLTTDSDLLWADDPRRAVTQALVSNLSNLTGAKVAAEPWPLDQFPDARLAVRFDRFLPDASGQFRASGQYYVARVNSGIRESARSFDLSAPYAPGNPISLSAAKAEVLKALAIRVASDSLR